MLKANNLASMASSEKQMLTGEQEKHASGLMGLWQICVAMLWELSFRISSSEEDPSASAIPYHVPKISMHVQKLELLYLCSLALHRYSSEFVLWAIEVKRVDVELLPKWEEKDLFK